MKADIYVGKDISGKNAFLDLTKEKLQTILLVGQTGSGKSVFHNFLYKQLMEQNSPEELGFVFLDMTRVDFSQWTSNYLYLPTIYDSKQALNAFELLGSESASRAKNDSMKKKSIFIHIEECDMVFQDKKRFEDTWVKISENKDRSNIYLVFSTSRVGREVLSEKILNNTDLKAAFTMVSEESSKLVLGKSTAEKFNGLGEKVLVFNNKEIFCRPFSQEELEEINEFEKNMQRGK